MDPVNLDLFAVAARKREAPPYQHGSDSSRDAARAIAPVAGTLRAAVLAVISEAPCTDEEGQDRSGISPNTWRPRRVELQSAGLIREAGTRPGKSGRQMVVWAAAGAADDEGP